MKMSDKQENLCRKLQEVLADRRPALNLDRGEITLELVVDDYLEAMRHLRDDPALDFEQLTDLCGVDYSACAGKDKDGKRFAVVVHLLSLTRNWRLRVRVFAGEQDGIPMVPSVTGLWRSADWYEREAFDLLGIVFPGHEDLRRILTDYDFSGHPLRKDFPVCGQVEMRYDPEQKRLIYEPVSITPRETIPRVVRESGYGGGRHD